MKSCQFLCLTGALLLSLLGCPESRHIPGDGDADGDADGDSDSDADEYRVVTELRSLPQAKLDLLFVVDNSNSMAEEQQVLTDQIGILLEGLLAPSEDEGAPFEDVHVGVVTTDMGTQGYTIMTCANPIHGDNGVLQNIGRLDGCEPTYSSTSCDRMECPWLDFEQREGPEGINELWDDFSCISRLGTGGCGFEQQLESSLQALTVQAGAGRPNEGFLRNDSILAILYVTDEDDCSTPEAEMFNPANEAYGPLNIRCILNEGDLYPVSRYRDAFIELRDGQEERVFIGVIAGVPVDGSWEVGDPLEELQELVQIDPSEPTRILESCNTSMGQAKPPPRLVELAYSFGRNGMVASICRGDWSRTFLDFSRRMVRDSLMRNCLNDELGADYVERCRVVEVLPDDRPCPHPADVAGPTRSSGYHRDLGVDGEDFLRRRCEILPADYDEDGCIDGASSCHAADGLQGWYVARDETECSLGELVLMPDDMAEELSDVLLECLP